MGNPDFSDLLYPSPAPATTPTPAVSTTPAPSPSPSPTPAPSTSGDDATDPNMAFKNMLGGLMGGGTGQQPDLLTILFSFLAMLITGKDTDAPGVDGANKTASQTAQEKQNTPDFDKNTTSTLTPAVVKTTANDLTALKTQAETANGGRHVEAISPVKGNVVISSGFGHRDAPDLGNGKHGSSEHAGLDVARADKNSPPPEIVSTMPGVVVGTGWKGGYGNTIDIMDIYGVRHRYGHLATGTTKVAVGDVVQQGQEIATMGSTGNSNGLHVHYEQRNASGDAINPEIVGKNWAVGQRIDYSKTELLLAQQNSKNVQTDNIVASTALNTNTKPQTNLPNNIQSAIGNMDFSYLQQGGGYVNTSVSNPKQTTTKVIGA